MIEYEKKYLILDDPFQGEIDESVRQRMQKWFEKCFSDRIDTQTKMILLEGSREWDGNTCTNATAPEPELTAEKLIELMR